MKNFFREFQNFLFASPVLPLLIICVSVCAAFLTADRSLPEDEPVPEYLQTVVQISFPPVSRTAVTTASTSTTSSTTISQTTTVTTAATTALPETEPPEEPQQQDQPAYIPDYNYSYISAGESPNSGFYQDRLVIIGDSIAYGYNAYGYIPSPHNIAKESLAVWNMNNYTFDMGGGAMGIIDAAAYVRSPLYFISIGMNDIFTYSPDDYAWRIRDIAEQVLERVPDATIVVGAITPVSAGNYYTGNDTIRSFNSSLEYVINDAGSSRLLFFNTNAVLTDPETGCLSYSFAGGDGLHLNSSAYSYSLNCLFNFLDETNAMEQINEHDNNLG